MTDIPYNYHKYIDDVTKMRQRGAISSGEQIASPSSAGSRGLAKTTQFTKNPTQMKLGESITMEDMKSLISRIDGLNAPVQEDADDWSKLTNALIKKYGEDKAKVITDFAQISTDSGPELMKNHGLTPKGDGEEDMEQYFQKFPYLRKMYDTSWMDRLINIAGEGPDYGTPVKMEDAGEKIANMAQNMTKDQFMSHADELGLTPEEAAEHYAKMQGGAHVQEAPKDSDIDYAKLMLQISAMKDKIAELPIDDDRKTSALTALGQVEDDLSMEESYEPFPEADEFNIEDDEDFEEVLGPLGFPEDETELFDAEYRGRKVPLNKPMRGDVKKFKVYVKDPKSGNVKKVNFGHGGTSAKRKTMRIRKSNPKARKSFRARHNCANPGPKTKARYWSCRKW